MTLVGRTRYHFNGGVYKYNPKRISNIEFFIEEMKYHGKENGSGFVLIPYK